MWQINSVARPLPEININRKWVLPQQVPTLHSQQKQTINNNMANCKIFHRDKESVREREWEVLREHEKQMGYRMLNNERRNNICKKLKESESKHIKWGKKDKLPRLRDDIQNLHYFILPLR